MSSPGVAGPSQLVALSGTEVGQLDPTQGSRILSTPGTRLSFASYDPFTASVDKRNLYAQDRLSIAKRIVIETLPDGTSTWRWVPRAKGVENVGDEGRWPRIIQICGQQVLCSQDQWDIYKLDPEYDCVVYSSPLLSTITRRENARKLRSSDLHAKRQVEGVVSDDEDEEAPSHKRTRTTNAEDVEEDLDSDDEVEELIDDGDNYLDHERKQQIRERRRKLLEERSRRRHKLKCQRERRSEPTVEDVSMIDLTLEDNLPLQSQPHSAHNPSSGIPQQEPVATSTTSADVPLTMPGGWREPTWAERTSSGNCSSAGTWSNTSSQTSWEESTRNSSQSHKVVPQLPNSTLIATIPSSSFGKMKRTMEPPSGPPSKRPRVVGPSSRRHDARRQRSEKRAKFYPSSFMNAAEASSFDGWRFMADIHFSKPTGMSQSSTNDDAGKVTGSPPSPDDVDPVSLEEKIERMRELNAFEDARRRAAQAEDEKRKAEEAEAARKRKQEEEVRLRREREERERREREQEQERRRREQQERAERIRKQKLAEEEMRRQLARLAHGPWTAQRALEHYKLLSDHFDRTQFTVDSPLTFLAVPWPVLYRPMQYGIEDIEWGAVEEFFKAVRLHMRAQEYRAFMEQSHRRFHPDRWRAKRILQSVEDENLRSCLEVADNIVSQAVTPVWLASKQS